MSDSPPPGASRVSTRSRRRRSLAWTVALLTLLLLLTHAAISAPVLADSVAAQQIPAINPVELRVPAAGIDASVQDVGTDDDGSMGVPSNFGDAAWFSYGYKPGQLGHAVFDGHVSSTDAAAVFFYVQDLQPGADVSITGDDGTVLDFTVTDVESYPLDSTPLGAIFGSSSWPEVVLITCGGDWHPDVSLFDHRTVVYASFISARAP